MDSENDLLSDAKVLRVLQESIQSGRLAHAILLYGENLFDLERVALKLSGQLLDTEADALMKHPDLFTLRPVNKMRQINAQDTRELIRKIQYSPNRAARKVALVYEVDRMNSAAANAFLKTLEEPPVDTTTFLLTTRRHDLLDTLNSRCATFRVPCSSTPVSDPEWREWLNHYTDWLGRLRAVPSSPEERANVIFSLYGLAAQFEAHLKRIARENWREQAAALPPGLTDEHCLALETGAYKRLRQRLFTELELYTRDFAHEHIRREGSGFSLPQFIQSIVDLEHCVHLLEVNLNETAALEYFLLRCLRNWTTS